MNIHFICRGNVLRSLIAETYLKSLKLNGIKVISSGTNVNWHDPQEQEYFFNTLRVLDRHNIKSFTKNQPDQLTVERLDTHHDIVVCMNQRVANEISALVSSSPQMLIWDITDIGEGNRTLRENREAYEEEIFQEIKQRVDQLVEANFSHLNSNIIEH